MTMSVLQNFNKNQENQDDYTPKSSNNLKKCRKYKLRDVSVKKRAEMAEKSGNLLSSGAPTRRKRGPKPRPKTAPMSKYRRRTANLRERLRMGEINVAFENLRDKLPNPMAQAGKAKCEKLTKINILHVAINYIRAMENLLETGDSGVVSFSEMTKNPLRDESDKKGEMARVLQTLMARADLKAAAAAAVQNQSSTTRKKQKAKNLFDDDDEDEETFTR
jgi:hypothetical protein